MQLNDMEETLSKIINPISKSLMKDALRSYAVGILRGGVVFTYLATIEHIKENCISIRDISDEVVKKWVDDVFLNPDRYMPESNIPDFLHCADRKLINEQQKNFLKDLIFKRNKCVHSDYEFTLTAEDVRYLYNNSIELFLKHNTVFGRSKIKQFLEFVRSSDNIFLNKNLDQCDIIINDNLRLNLDLKICIVFYNEIIECYKESNNGSALRNNLDKIIYLSCKKNRELFDYFMKKSIENIAKNDIGIDVVIYSILLRINSKDFIKCACKYDKDNFLRLLPDILSTPSSFSSLEIKNGELVDILLENDLSDLDNDFLNLLIRFKLDIEKGKNSSIFDFTYEILNKMDFNIIDKYIPKYQELWEYIASMFSDEECYKVYLRLLKNNILLRKENVMGMVAFSNKYNPIRLKAESFLKINQTIDFEKILFSNKSYCDYARYFNDPTWSEINIWNEIIIDNDLLKILNDEDIASLIREDKEYLILKDLIIKNLNELKLFKDYKDKKDLLLNFLKKESNNDTKI